LHEFIDIFSTKPSLPPPRSIDHEIPLKPNRKPPSIRPYRVPYKQKDEVEKLIQTMLKDELIRPSNSPYSSPAIFIRKKMGLGGSALTTESLILKQLRTSFQYQ
jgi:hypothetical protein